VARLASTIVDKWAGISVARCAGQLRDSVKHHPATLLLLLLQVVCCCSCCCCRTASSRHVITAVAAPSATLPQRQQPFLGSSVVAPYTRAAHAVSPNKQLFAA